MTTSVTALSQNTVGTAAEIQDLTVVYPEGRRALHDVTVTVPAGSTVAVIGESGCGKSTLIKAMLGLLPGGATVSGTVRVDGQDVIGAPETTLRSLRGTRVGYVSQDAYGGLDPLMRIGANVEEAWRAKSLPVPDGAAADRLHALGIADAAARLRDWPHTWSGGMQQRATIAAATALGPALVVADEPTSALDARTAETVLDRLRAQARSLLVVSHDLPLVGRFADLVYVLRDGVVVEHGPTAQVLHSPTDPYTRSLLDAFAPIRTAAPDGPDPTSDPVVVAEAVTQRYDGRTVLPPTSLQVRRGDIVGIRGPSGTGKSTLLRILAGLERAASGTIDWAGSRSPATGSVQMIFQDAVGSLDPRWPIWRSVTEPLRLRRRAARAVAASALLDLGLDDVPLDARPSALSGGQCQRVALARALVARSPLILADEPTAALDPTVGRQVLRALRTLADAGTAIVMVSHDDRALASVCDRVLEIGEQRP